MKVLQKIVIQAAFAAAIWFGFVEGVQGAEYVAKFLIWGVNLPLAFMCFFDVMHRKLAENPKENALVSGLTRAIAWATLGILVWHGHIATACAWMFWMIGCAVAREGTKKHRATSNDPIAV